MASEEEKKLIKKIWKRGMSVWGEQAKELIQGDAPLQFTVEVREEKNAFTGEELERILADENTYINGVREKAEKNLSMALKVKMERYEKKKHMIFVISRV